ADLQRRRGEHEQALHAYDRALDVDPALSDAALGRALTLVAMRRYADARDQLEAGMTHFPGQTGFAHALARVLAAAPDDTVRDGRRALALVQALLEKDRSTEVGEALAMALAELRRFDEAAAVQRDLIAAARRARQPGLARALGDNLKLYEARRPARTVWRGDEVGAGQTRVHP